MINRIWSGKNKLYWLLTPFSLLYGLIVSIRRNCYRLGLFNSWRAPIPVIVVGNLSVGGNGKTPLVIYLIEQLRQKGYRVGVVSRGYGGSSRHYPVQVDDTATAEVVGDEPFLIYQRTKVPIAVSPKRSEAIKLLLASYELDLIITDDGLQHYALQRDIEIVVVDGKKGFGNGWYLPAGPLRELPSRLNSVDYLIINGQTEQSYKQSYSMILIPHNAINLKTGEQLPVSKLQSVCAIAGIGDPNRFFTMLKTLNVDIIHTVAFNDHQPYTLMQLSSLVKSKEILLMTEKDAVKCLPFAQNNWWYLPIDAQLPKEFIDNLCEKIKQLNDIQSKRN